jgi:hypothetical protein
VGINIVMRINKPLNQKQKFYDKKANIKKVFKHFFVNHLSIVLFANLINESSTDKISVSTKVVLP